MNRRDLIKGSVVVAATVMLPIPQVFANDGAIIERISAAPERCKYALAKVVNHTKKNASYHILRHDQLHHLTETLYPGDQLDIKVEDYLTDASIGALNPCRSV